MFTEVRTLQQFFIVNCSTSFLDELMLHENGLSNLLICLFNDILRIQMKHRPRDFRNLEEIIEKLASVVVEEIGFQEHDYERHLTEALFRIDEELSKRHVGSSLKDEVIEGVREYAYDELEYLIENERQNKH